jgi:biopolymer transport protein ExbD
MKIKIIKSRSPRIEMLPLIDVVFLLLVVFIYAMLSMAVHRGMPVALPTSATAQPDTHAVVAVTVTAGGDIFVDQEAVTLDNLKIALERLAADDKETGVLLFADRQLPYQALFRVLDQVRRAGLHRISLQAEPEASP